MTLQNTVVQADFYREEKTCTGCDVSKPLSGFHRQKDGVFGRHSRCIECSEKRRKANYRSSDQHAKYEAKKLQPKVTPHFITCNRCGETKEYSEFHRASNHITGRQQICKKCKNSAHTKRRHEDDVFREKLKKQHRLRRRKYRYGITQEMFDALFIAQEKKCAICEKELLNKPNLDHCHATGKIRGILCAPCNFMLGAINDREDLLLRAIQYLAKYRDIK